MRCSPGPPDRGSRLDQYLSRALPELSRSQIQQLNRSGQVLVDGRVEKAGYRVRGGEEIHVVMPGPRSDGPSPEDIPLEIVYADSDLAVINKPAGLVVHPGAGVREGTLVNALLHHLGDLSDAGGAERPGIVHRIDKLTSGLIVVARNNASHTRLGKDFHDRRVRKHYVALVYGMPRRSSGTIDQPIRRHPSIRTRMQAAKSGRAAVTDYAVREVFAGAALLDIQIHTGRTHQIRVHLASIGHPVIGDVVYGPAELDGRVRALTAKLGPVRRYFLHSAELAFAHPRTGEALAFRCPLPPDFEAAIFALRGRPGSGYSRGSRAGG